MRRIGRVQSGTNRAVCEAANEHCNARIINLLMWEAASRMVLTTTLPPSSHLPASLLRRTMNLVIIQIKMRMRMVVMILMGTMIWFGFDNTALDTTLVMPNIIDRNRSEPVSSKPGNSSWPAGEQVPHETGFETLR